MEMEDGTPVNGLSVKNPRETPANMVHKVRF